VQNARAVRIGMQFLGGVVREEILREKVLVPGPEWNSAGRELPVKAPSD
jgi:hypothetical protein